ncbi:hypothetical protein C8Q79DRAFT_905529, partial [Trametes meyenii]
LRGILIENSPYCSGTVKLPPSSLVLFYGKDKDARQEDLDTLQQTCDPATFGLDEKEVFDESYRKAGKLDKDQFAIQFDPCTTGILDAVRTSLLSGTREDERYIRAELYKLNVYGQNAFFKVHKDTPDSESMLGSLVVVLPTPHEGGALLLRHEGRQWSFDSAGIFDDLHSDAINHIAYVAFFGDVDHEVAPVKSGHRITLTYNLYFDEKASSHWIREDIAILEPARVRQSKLEAALSSLIGDPTFLPTGGKLGFGLRYQYPFPMRDHRGKPALDKLGD